MGTEYETKHVAPEFREACKKLDPCCVIRKYDQVVGWPDYEVWWSDRAPWGRGITLVELKAPDKTATDRQTAQHDRLEGVSGIRPALVVGHVGVRVWAAHDGLYCPVGTVLFATRQPGRQRRSR